MLVHPHESWVNNRSRSIVKFFFFSQLEPAERVKLMQSRLMTQLRLEIEIILLQRSLYVFR